MNEITPSSLLINEQLRQTVVLFRLEHQTYAVPIERVRQIVEMVTISPIPQVTHSVAGVINFHGVTVPVINLRHHLGMSDLPLQLHTPIILVLVQDRLMGLLVDEVLDVQGLPADHLINPEDVLPEEFGDNMAIASLAQTSHGLVIVLDLAHIFKPHHAQALLDAAHAFGRAEPLPLVKDAPSKKEKTASEPLSVKVAASLGEPDAASPARKPKKSSPKPAE